MENGKKVNYYPVSIEKLQRASMREAAYLIAPVNIGEDYEYFDKVKHLLDIPDKPYLSIYLNLLPLNDLYYQSGKTRDSS